MSVEVRCLMGRKARAVSYLRLIIGGTVLACNFAGTSCVPEMPSRCSQYESFFNLSPNQRESKFKSSSMQDQYEMYLCGMYRHPPHLELADYFADRKETAIPFLVEKLKVVKNEGTQRDIIYIFRAISERDNSLRDRQDVIDLLQQTISNMKRETIKERSQQFLDDIINSKIK